jgi:DNA-binding protein HU-beta
MYKTELIAHMATQAGISKTQAKLALNAYMSAVQTSLQKGGAVSLIGFGSFYVENRRARNGVNPRTMAPITTPAMKIPKFRAGKSLKNALNY